jgi:fructose-specific PTS system IIA-like component
MIEVPAAAYAIEDLSAHVDFYSIGTNDLAQYFFAVDRGNAAVSHLYNYLAPPFLRLLKKIVDDAHAQGKWVGMCGEMAGDARALPLLVGMGLNEISMAAPAIPRTRAALSKLTIGESSRVLHDALACTSAAQVERLLADFPRPASDLPLVAPELILANSDCATKEEAIKELADALFLAGRTSDPGAVEAVIWQREAVYSTGLGFGFAIPHCKTDLVLANSIAVLKAGAPIAWGSLDGNPVNVVILLAVRESDAQNSHMKIFARLARKVMHEEFREFLTTATDPEEIRVFIEKHLGIDHQAENR